MTFLMQFGLVFAIMLNLVWAFKFTRLLWKIADEEEAAGGKLDLPKKIAQTMCSLKIHIHLLYALVFIMIVSHT